MSLYAIGDLHLHFQSEVKSKAQKKDRLWKRNEEKFQKNCLSLLKEEDTLVLVGDHSWGRKRSTSFTPIATGSTAFTTAFWAKRTESGIIWCPGIICAGCRRR